MAVRKITKQLVDSSPIESKSYFIWDTDVKGFALKVSTAGRKTYICEYRTAGGRAGIKRRYTIGRHGSPWTADMARDEARKLLGSVAHGEDPRYSQAIAEAPYDDI
jgi:Arm DNA-binding domain